jgi:hypothetical protein
LRQAHDAFGVLPQPEVPPWFDDWNREKLPCQQHEPLDLHAFHRFHGSVSRTLPGGKAEPTPTAQVLPGGRWLLRRRITPANWEDEHPAVR